jgi:hypothetical protein
VAAALAASEAHKAAAQLAEEQEPKDGEAKEGEEKKDEEKKEEGEEKEKEEKPSPAEKEGPKSKRNKELWQRVNNWKLAVRLNSEILSQQTKMKDMLRSNKYLIPEVSTQQKADAFVLVREYVAAARTFIDERAERFSPEMTDTEVAAFLSEFEAENPIALAVVSAPQLAISTNVGCRVVKLAALLDNAQLLKLLEEDVHSSLVLTRVPKLVEWGKNLLEHFRTMVL